MARKSAIQPKKGQGPGYSDEGFTPRGADCVITYRVSGLAGDDEAQELACGVLWAKMRKGLSASTQAHGTHEATAGPKIDGAGDVVYSLYTVWRGEAEEEGFRFNLQERTGGVVAMSKAPVPAAPTPIPGIDAPAVEAVGK